MSLKTTEPVFDGRTKLSSTGLEFVDVVLTERFLLPPVALRKMGESVPETLADVAVMSGMDLDNVIEVVRECLALSQDLYFEMGDLQTLVEQDGAMILDMRPEVTFETEPLHPAAKIFHMQNPAQMLPFLRSLNQVIVLSEPASHAWSAALALRKMQIKAFLWKPA